MSGASRSSAARATASQRYHGAGVGLLDGRSEPDRPQHAEPPVLRRAADERGETLRAGLRDLVAHARRVDGQQVSVDDGFELPDGVRHRRVACTGRRTSTLLGNIKSLCNHSSANAPATPAPSHSPDRAAALPGASPPPLFGAPNSAKTTPSANSSAISCGIGCGPPDKPAAPREIFPAGRVLRLVAQRSAPDAIFEDRSGYQRAPQPIGGFGDVVGA